MAIEFSPLEGKSRQFHAFMLILFVIAGAGLLATYLFYARGLHLTGMSNRVPWGISIVMAVFYIGLSAGSLVLSAMSALFGKKEFKPFARIAALLAMLLLVGALLSIILDWGRPDRLFVPFTDITTGAETYPGGRYLDLDRTATGIYQIDFNQAYHPFCYFDDRYDCPYPPPENRLGVPLRAGERLRE